MSLSKIRFFIFDRFMAALAFSPSIRQHSLGRLGFRLGLRRGLTPSMERSLGTTGVKSGMVGPGSGLTLP